MARSLLTPTRAESPAVLLARPWLRVPPAGDAAVMDVMLDMFGQNPRNFPSSPSPSPTVLGPNDSPRVAGVRQGCGYPDAEMEEIFPDASPFPS